MTLCPQDIACQTAFQCDDKIFAAAWVIPEVAGETIVMWQLGTNRLRGSVEYKLQIGRGGIETATDWEDVTEFEADVMQLVDTERRSAGWYRRTYYRVVAKDSTETEYFSSPIPANQARLNPTTDRHYQEILRRERKRYGLRNTPASRGYLLKIKYYGDPCTDCVDEFSGEPLTDDCETCFGVGYELGYHPPFPCFTVDLGGVPKGLRMYESQGPIVTGTQTQIRYLNIPPVHPWDIWVDEASDYRYMIGQIEPITSFGSVDLICKAVAGRLAFDHPVYKIPMP